MLRNELEKVRAGLKNDIEKFRAELKRDIHEIGHELTIKLGAIVVIGITVLSVLDKLF